MDGQIYTIFYQPILQLNLLVLIKKIELDNENS